MDIHPIAAAGFSIRADAYAQSRPRYPLAAVESICRALSIKEGRVVLDLGSGTGILTGELIDTGATVVGAEPSSAMREEFRRHFPVAPVVAGTAESLPFATGTLDAITCGQAFHWFDASRALSEFARTLRDAGSFALVWNERDRSNEFVAGLEHVMQWDVKMPYDVGRDFSPVVDSSMLFLPCRREQFTFVDVLSRESVVERVATTSYIASMEPRARSTLLEDVWMYLEPYGSAVELPYRTSVYIASRR